MLEFVVNIVQSLRIGPDAVRVGVVSYATQSTVNFVLDQHTNKPALVDAIKNIPYVHIGGDSTNTAAGIEYMRMKVFTLPGDRPDVQNIGIVITDGLSNEQNDMTIPNAEKAKKDGIIMLAVGITDKVNVAEIAGISSNGAEGETYFLSPEFNVTEEIVQNIVNQTCSQAGTGMNICPL